MTTQATVVCDSLNAYGSRLTTMVVTFPRIILAEFNTHRRFSRNSSSTRAIPIERIIEQVVEHPFVPSHWGKNEKGMVAHSEVECTATCESIWMMALENAIKSAKIMASFGVHKQVVNQLLTPWMWQTAIVSSTEWNHFFALRDNEAAHPEFQRLAKAMKAALESSTPRQLNKWIDYHVPFVSEAEEKEYGDDCLIISAGRCAQVSYNRHEKQDAKADIERAKRLLKAGHMSPFEHQAWSAIFVHDNEGGNFGPGWVQFRKTLPNEGAFHEITT